MDHRIIEFLTGGRPAAGLVVSANPFYNAHSTRAHAESAVSSYYTWPIIRPSSHAGFYAVTFFCKIRRCVIHSLLRQNADLSVDVLDDAHNVYARYVNIYELLSVIIWGHRSHAPAGPLPPRPPLIVSPAVVAPRGGEPDPV